MIKYGIRYNRNDWNWVARAIFSVGTDLLRQSNGAGCFMPSLRRSIRSGTTLQILPAQRPSHRRAFLAVTYRGLILRKANVCPRYLREEVDPREAFPLLERVLHTGFNEKPYSRTRRRNVSGATRHGRPARAASNLSERAKREKKRERERG